MNFSLVMWRTLKRSSVCDVVISIVSQTLSAPLLHENILSQSAADSLMEEINTWSK